MGECTPEVVYSRGQYFSRKRDLTKFHGISPSSHHLHHLHQRWAGVEGYPKQEIAQVRQGSAHQVSQEGRMGLCRHCQAVRSAAEAAEVKNRPRKTPSKNTYKCVIPVPSAPHEEASEAKTLSKAFQALTGERHCSGTKSQPSRGRCRT